MFLSAVHDGSAEVISDAKIKYPKIQNNKFLTQRPFISISDAIYS
jgi:hypothetical protein